MVPRLLRKHPCSVGTYSSPIRWISNSMSAKVLGHGEDTEGNQFKNIDDVWKSKLSSKDGEAAWYQRASDYWNSQDSSVDGVLGGFSKLHSPDIAASLKLVSLMKKMDSPPEFGTVVDCGAGIGRITKDLLMKHFKKVDLLEACEKYVKTAEANLGKSPKTDKFFCMGLQDFEPEPNRYDVIWNQWVLLYLTDAHLVSYLKRAKSALRENGVIVVKENVVLGDCFVVDNEDNSVTRTDQQYKQIFKKAGLDLKIEMRQTQWPRECFPVMMYVLRSMSVPPLPSPPSPLRAPGFARQMSGTNAPVWHVSSRLKGDKAGSKPPSFEEEVKRSLVLFTARGEDKPGISLSLIECLASLGDAVVLMDISQILIDGLLLLSFLVEVEESKVTSLMKDILLASRGHDVHIDMHYLDEDGGISPRNSSLPFCSQRGQSGIASGRFEMTPGTNSVSHFSPSSSLSMTQVLIVAKKLNPEMLILISNLLKKNGWNIENISHEEPRPPIDLHSLNLKISPLHPLKNPKTSRQELYLQLQKSLWEVQAELVVRPWEVNSRPNRRGLIVFGLSEVLVYGDVLDQVLSEAGQDPEAVLQRAGGKDLKCTSAAVSKRMAALTGAPASVLDRVCEKLEFVKGVREVCAVLNHLGYKLALITSSGVSKKIIRHVQKELDLHYALGPDCEIDEQSQTLTGKIADSYSLDDMRKVDLMRLVADKEGVSVNDSDLDSSIIVVGDYFHADYVFSSCAYRIHFNASKLQDFRVILSLLGFESNDLHDLRKVTGVDEGSIRSLETPKRCLPPGASSVNLRLTGPDRPGLLGKICESLRGSEVGGVVQSNLHGVLCLGIQARMDEEEARSILKDVLWEAHSSGLTLDYYPAERSLLAEGEAAKKKMLVTVVQQPHLSCMRLTKILEAFLEFGVNIETSSRLDNPMSPLSALQWAVSVPEEGVDLKRFRRRLLDVGIDVAVQSDNIQRLSRRLIVFDMDSTLIQQEVIDELGRYAGVEKEVVEITEAAMRGDIDFFESLRQRVALLKGQDASRLVENVKKNIIFTPGVRELCRTLKVMGLRMAVISGGFLPFARFVKSELGLDYAFANELETDEEGKLTGKTVGPVVTPQRKKQLLDMISEVEGCSLTQTIACGDGANDIPMLEAAGLGVAFCAKPKVQERTEFRINTKDISTLMYLLGVSKGAEWMEE